MRVLWTVKYEFDYLLVDEQHNKNDEMLTKKLKIMEHQYGLKPTDDIAIIRIIYS